MKKLRFEMRMDVATMRRLDAWRAQQSINLARSEAVRRFIRAGIDKTQNARSEFRFADKLILLMLCDLYKQSGVRNSFDPDFVGKMIRRGHYRALDWSIQSYLTSQPTHQDWFPRSARYLTCGSRSRAASKGSLRRGRRRSSRQRTSPDPHSEASTRTLKAGTLESRES